MSDSSDSDSQPELPAASLLAKLQGSPLPPEDALEDEGPIELDGAADELSSELDDLVSRSRKGTAGGASGELVSSGVHELAGPGLEVVGLGLLPLPVDANVFAALQRLGSTSLAELIAEPSGLGFANPSWRGSVPAPILHAVTKDLAVPAGATCAATLRGLFISGPGGDVSLAACLEKEPGAWC